MAGAVIDGGVENGSLIAGQAVGMVEKELSTAAILDGLVDQAMGALMDRHRMETAE